MSALPAPLVESLAEAKRGVLRYLDSDALESQLSFMWEPPEAVESPAAPHAVDARDIGDMLHSLEEERQPGWSIGMTSNFKKDIQSIDRTVQGRLLLAIADLCDNPIELRGDTKKPLTNQLKGCWRYRVGPYRLVYLPNSAARTIALIAFDSRGSIYD